MVASWYAGDFIFCPLFVLVNEVAGIKYGAGVPWVWVYVNSDKAIYILQERLNALPEELVG